MRIGSLLMGLMMMAGCAQVGAKLDPTKIALAYYNQPRTYQSFAITGAHTISMTGSNLSMVATSPMHPLSVYPRNPSALSEAGSAVTKLGAVVGATLVGQSLASGPQVVHQQPPTVVRPEVVTIPSGN